MTFQPFVIGEGLGAWAVLKSTLSSQKDAFETAYSNRSDTAYFRQTYSDIMTADDVVSDRRKMRVILGAYGLSDDLDNRHFIKTILSEGVAEPTSLANKLSDRRYRSLAKDFDFSTAPPKHKTTPALMEKTISRYLEHAFETEIGRSDADMRLALNFSRDLSDIAQATSSNATAWFQVLATPPLREVFQTSLRLPQEFAQLDIDEQHERIMDKATRVYGTNDISELASADMSEAIIRRFLVSRQADNMSSYGSFQTALVLLSGMASSTMLQH